jgi:lipopolysaccharide biosynthesis glycosyltransferase
MIELYVGFDPREALAYHVFCQSVIERTSMPVSFKPLALSVLRTYEETHTDGSNQFIYTRFLVPALQDFAGWAVFVDGDMVCTRDMAELWALRDSRYAVQVVRHPDYKTKHPVKYIGTTMETVNASYPRKQWSSVVLWNCAHPSNRVLTPSYVQKATGSHLHRFEWLKDEEIGALPPEWNALIGEQEHDNPAVAHYTLGVPGIEHYRDCDHADLWHSTKTNLLRCG